MRELLKEFGAEPHLLMELAEILLPRNALRCHRILIPGEEPYFARRFTA